MLYHVAVMYANVLKPLPAFAFEIIVNLVPMQSVTDSHWNVDNLIFSGIKETNNSSWSRTSRQFVRYFCYWNWLLFWLACFCTTVFALL